MAINIIDEPYNWAVRGQKLMVIASSTESTQNGFRYGVNVTIDGTPYDFYIPAAPDGYLYFDVAPLLDDMRNYEPLSYHFSTNATQDDLSKRQVVITVNEWWIVSGVLTKHTGSDVTLDEKLAVNGYFQSINGYKPNVELGDLNVRQSLTSNKTYAMSDRKFDTHVFRLAQTWLFGATPNTLTTWIPSYENDYGLLCIPGNNGYLSNNEALNMKITIYSSTGAPFAQTIALNGYDIEALPVYPGNLNDWSGLTVKPSLFPDWRLYTVSIRNAVAQKSLSYVFYNVAKYGISDCRNDKIRLGWVNSRGGWDYFNFTKRSEYTDEIDRKTYRKVLFNGTTSVFNANDRGLQDRRNLMQQVLSITSDYISENEFTFLRSLLVSNQITWLKEDGNKIYAVPVKLDDTNYTEKKTRDGKLYNLTLKVRMANEYWT